MQCMMGISTAVAKKNNKPNKAKHAAQPTARAPTVMVTVSSPTVPGARESVQRAVTTIDYLHQRRHISDREHLAATKFKNAHDVVFGTIGGAMDPDRARGSGSPGSPPPPSWLLACDVLHEAKVQLYSLDYSIVEQIAGHGHSLRDVAAQIYGVGVDGRPSRNDFDRISDRLKAALSELASMWFGVAEAGATQPVRSVWRGTGAKPAGSDATSVPQGTAAHATGKRVFRS
jgi:hypothetical protein